MAYTLLTGATGLLGRYLLRDLLAADVKVVVVVRASRWESAAQRIETLMTRWEAEAGRTLPRPVVLSGNLHEPDLGLTANDIAWLTDHCDSIIHSAASLTFHAESPEGEPWISNIHGTRHVLELCRRAKIRQFHHVSTAYVCGLRSGVVLERELNVGQTPGNDYEISKLTSEQEVHRAEFLDSLTVYRPSIIVGDAQTGYTNTFHGFYSPLRLVFSLLGGMSFEDVKAVDYIGMLGMQGHERKNFVPVDWVSAAMAHIFTNPQHHGQTYHLTSAEPVTVNNMRLVFEEALGRHLAKGQHKQAAAFHNVDFQDAFHDQMKVYRSYWRDDPTFDMRNTLAATGHIVCPPIDDELLHRLAKFAIDANFGWPREASVPIRLSVEQRLAPWLAADGASDIDSPARRVVGLQVNGNGGGQWHVTLDGDEPLAAALGLSEECGSICYLNSGTLDLFAQGSLSPEDAFALGCVAVLGTSLDAGLVARVLQSIALGRPLDAALSGSH